MSKSKEKQDKEKIESMKSKEEMAKEYSSRFSPENGWGAEISNEAFLAGYDARQAEVEIHERLCSDYESKIHTLNAEVQELKKEVDELRKAKCDHIDQKHRSAAKYEDEIQEIKRLKKDLLLAQLSRNDWESISKNLAVQIQELKKEVDELRKAKCDHIDQKHWSAAKYEDEIQEIKKDKERLDFMLSQFAMVQRFQDGTCRLWAAAGSMTYETPREAIDAAMKESKDGK